MKTSDYALRATVIMQERGLCPDAMFDPLPSKIIGNPGPGARCW